jgi:hypothetical protein
MKTTFTKKDLITTFACIVFLLLTVSAVGPRGRRHAKDMLCLSNLQKWGTVFHAFLQDNNGKFMAGWRMEHLTHKDYWMDALRPYYGNNHKLRCCPEATVPGTEIGGDYYGGNGTFTAWGIFEGECGQPTTSWASVTACDYGSYGNNAWTCDPPPGSMHDTFPEINNWRTVIVDGANHIPLFGDHQWLDCWPQHSDEPPEYEGQPWHWYLTSQMGRICINRHQGFVNWVFLDFSTRKVGLKELWTLKWHRNYEIDYPPPIWPEWMQNFPDY